MLTVAVDAWIGNAAAVLSGVWGAVTRRAEQSGYSRTAIYQHAEHVVEAVANEQASNLSYNDLWAENQRLRAENQDLWQALEESQGLPQSKQLELASAAFAMGLSLTPIMTILSMVLSGLGVPSRATVGRWVQHSCEQAGRVLAVLDEACRARVVTLCLDEALCRLWYWRSQRRRLPDLRQARVAALAVLQEQLCQRLSEDWEQAYAEVAQLITHTVRASSAVECMNSVLRMHQNRHRYVSQAMLDLKRLFWNCRRFSHGKRRKACPYELLGLDLPTYNWWKLLRMEPEELRQQLSTQEVAV